MTDLSQLLVGEFRITTGTFLACFKDSKLLFCWFVWFQGEEIMPNSQSIENIVNMSFPRYKSEKEFKEYNSCKCSQIIYNTLQSCVQYDPWTVHKIRN